MTVQRNSTQIFSATPWATLWHCLVILILCVCGLTVECSAKPWKKWKTDDTNAAAESRTGNPICDQITKNVDRRIESMKALKKEIANAATAPPSSLFGALEGMMGENQPDAAVVEKTKKLASERKVAEDLNSMLRASQCPPVDIEHELAHVSTSGSSSPKLPDVPNLLPQVPTPASR